MADALFQVLADFFSRYGYWVVFFGVMLENTGLPVPGETVLIFAGFLAYHGELRLDRAIAIAILGATTGDSLGYCLGRFGGKAFIEKYPKRIPFFARQFDRAQALFKKHGHWAVFIGRFITGLRIFAGVLAGLFRMRYRRFLFFNFTGAVCWAITFGCVGFIFGESWEGLVSFVRRFQRLTQGVLLAGIVVAAVAYLKRRRSSK